MKLSLRNFKKPIAITFSLVVLQLIWGFDPKFSVINIVWLLIQDYE